MTPEDAYAAVTEAANLFPRDRKMLYSKRIDSTLRGNVGAEIDAILDYLGESYTAVVVPAFPASGRTCVGDIQMVNGVPLQLTEVSRDPITPMSDSRVTRIVSQQTKRSVGYIGIEDVVGKSLHLLEVLQAACEAYDIVVVDAITDHDVRAIAACCAASGYDIVSIDPGAFTAARADYTFNRSKYETDQAILAVVGSATELTMKQIAYLKEKDVPFTIKANIARFFDAAEREAEITRLVEAIEQSVKKYQILAITTTESAADLLDFSKIAGAAGLDRRERSRVITDALAEAAVRVLDSAGEAIGGLYASGGDVSVAVCERLGISGFDVKNEVIPLAIYSRLTGGTRHEMPVVTKGGLIGSPDTLFNCINYLKSEIR